MKRFIFGMILSVLGTLCCWVDCYGINPNTDFVDDDGLFLCQIWRQNDDRHARIVCLASEEALNKITASEDLVLPSSICRDGVEYTVKYIESSWCDYMDSDFMERVSVPFIRTKNCYIPNTLYPGYPGYKFYDCILCEAFIVEEDHPTLKAIDGVLLSGKGTYLVRYPVLSREEIWRVPDGVEDLTGAVGGLSTYAYGDGLYSGSFFNMWEGNIPKILQLPSSLTECGIDLRDLTVDVKVEFNRGHEYFEVIDNFIIDKRDYSLHAVAGLKFMDQVVVPNEVKRINNDPIFWTYDSKLPGTKQNYYYDSFWSHAPIVLPEGLESIGSYGFRGLGSREVHLPKTVTEIGCEIFYKSCVRCVEIPGNPQTVERSFFNWWEELGMYLPSAWSDDDIREYGRDFSREIILDYGSLQLVELGEEPAAFDKGAFFQDYRTLMTKFPLRHLVSHIEDPFAEWPTATPSQLFTFDLRPPHWGILWVPEGTVAKYAEAVVAGIWPKCERIREIGDGLIVMCEPVNSSFHFDEVVENTGIRVTYEHTYAVGDVEFDRFDGFRSSDESVATIDEDGRLVLHGEGETLITAVSLDTEGREYAHEYRVSVGPRRVTDISEMPIQSTGAAYYTLQGQFAGTDPSGLSSGLYVRREAGLSTKILIP